MNLIEMLPVSYPVWDSVDSDLSIDRLNKLKDVYVENQVPPENPKKYIGRIIKVTKDTLVIEYKNTRNESIKNGKTNCPRT